jgi:predicted cobalt transporter CbtA
MEFVVVPLSAAAKPRFTVASLLENVLAMLLFGLIVSFFARRQPRHTR